MIRSGTNIINTIVSGTNVVKFIHNGSNLVYPDGFIYNSNACTTSVRFGGYAQKSFNTYNNPLLKNISDFMYTYSNSATPYLNGFTVTKSGYYLATYKTKITVLSGHPDPGIDLNMGIFKPIFNEYGYILSANYLYLTGLQSISRGSYDLFSIINYRIYCNANDVITFGGSSPLDNSYVQESEAYCNLIYNG